MSRLRVGMNLLFLGEASGGVGRSACELSGALVVRDDVELEVVTTREGLPVLQAEPWWGEARVYVIAGSRAQRGRYVAASYLGAPGWARWRHLDVLHSPANVGPLATPGVANVITVNDLIWMHAGADWGDANAVATMRKASAACLPRAHGVITISEWSAMDIASTFSVAPGNITVTPLGVRIGLLAPAAAEEDSIRRQFELVGARVILCVAQKRPYKRQDVIVRALAALPDDVVAVLPGAPTAWEDELRRLAQLLGVAERVRFPSWVSERELEGLYAISDVCVFPSVYEGFGLPVLEAMARGVPVVCSNRTALPEVAGDAALLVDPDLQDEVDAAVRTVLDGPEDRDRLIAAGRLRAAEFTWDRTANETVEAYLRACAGRRGRHRLR